ncbi:hypothetical protein P691DRAFT_675897 [Macrolepiota fuliginosa MF-IS2]|uniref:Uncharacterized protein n=1 Tax=Macrolepiota fuliginosa MF-IS2 TaxID=1400762 RepID=A0A9P5X6C2_9AGAR|nr:hypothetical protein P691DRAFT_675897 [Macrolepiota fuliginosa MF-IS2]
MIFKVSTILLAILVTAQANPVPRPAPQGAFCLAICYFQKPNCTPPSFASGGGNCWTCCTPQN